MSPEETIRQRIKRKIQRKIHRLERECGIRLAFKRPDGRAVILRTNGKGLWSATEALVHVTSVALYPCSRALGELRVYFDRRTWSVKKNGLIYTDRRFLVELRDALTKSGFKAARTLHYSEQGMQGEDYVSLDAGEVFTEEFMAQLDGATVWRAMSAGIERQDEMSRMWRRIRSGKRKRSSRK